MLRWAAVLGQEFSVTDLKVVTGLAASDLIEVITEAVAAGVTAEAGPAAAVRARPDPPGGLREHAGVAAIGSAPSGGPRAGRGGRGARARRRRSSSRCPELTDGWVRDWLAKTAPVLAYRAPKVTADLLRARPA